MSSTLGKWCWPANLAVFYPHPGLWPFWQTAGAGFLLVAITGAVILTAKKYPYMIIGWLWFVGTLVPVIGIVQIENIGRADRFIYIPAIGLFIMGAWGAPELLKSCHRRKDALLLLSVLVLFSLSITTWTQVGYWRDDVSLFKHAVKVTSRNFSMYADLGLAHLALGDQKQAIADCDKAIEINPEYAPAYCNRGMAYSVLGNPKQAITDYDRAIAINPRFAKAFSNRAAAYMGLGDYKQAIVDYDKAIEIDPTIC